MTRLIAIGDIHGGSYELGHLLQEIQLQSTDTLVTVGDYVDRGIDSRGVLDMLIALSREYHVVPILGNHDEMMLRALDDPATLYQWIEIGGKLSLDSYGDPGNPGMIPMEHVQFLRSCLPFFETDTHIFTHANYDPLLPFDQQSPDLLRWRSLHTFTPGPHVSGKQVIVGHTPYTDVLDLGHLVCIDTGCGFDGRLTAMEVGTGQLWQVG
jgi:serine/threonine protein phosphatase 1